MEAIVIKNSTLKILLHNKSIFYYKQRHISAKHVKSLHILPQTRSYSLSIPFKNNKYSDKTVFLYPLVFEFKNHCFK